MSQITSSFGKPETHVPSRPRTRNSQLVQAFLTRFAKRQTLFRCIQGGGQLIVVVIAIATLIALADGMRWLSDGVRWTASCLAYGLAFATAWRCGLAAFWKAKDFLGVAHSIEVTDPRFRESLLSSVELRRADGTARSGSEAFVSAIEQEVAKEVQRVDIDDLLPWTMVVRGLTACSLVLVITLLLCSIPGLHYAQRLARAMLPFVSLTRPSNVRIKILEPSPASLSVPDNQSLRFLVEVEGTGAQVAAFEFLDETGPSTKSPDEIAMQLESEQPKRFSLVTNLGNSAKFYRICCGDGETVWHKIEPLSRPKPLQFNTKVTLPDYVDKNAAEKFYKLSESSVQGNVRVLAGSRVRLELDTNQALKQGSMELERIHTGKKMSVPLVLIPSESERALATGATHSYGLELDVSEDAKVQFRLQSHLEFQGSPLENTFSPFYKIEALEDEEAQLAWSVNETTLWRKLSETSEIFVVAPNELVNLSVTCFDNLPVDTLDFEWSRNRGPWRRLKGNVAIEERLELDIVRSSREAQSPAIRTFTGFVNWNWDLADLKVEGGDTLQCRAKCIDMKGAISYSPTVAMTVSAIGFERDRYDTLEQLAKLVAPLKDFADSLSEKRTDCLAAMEVLKNPSSTSDQRSVAAKLVRDTAIAGGIKARSIRALAEPIVKNLKRCMDQSDVELALRCISKIEKEWLIFIEHWGQQQLIKVGPDEIVLQSDWFRKDRESKLDRMQQAFEQACEQSTRTLDLYRQFVGFELQTALTKDLTGLMTHQQTILDRKPNASFENLVRSQKLSEQFCKGAIRLASDYGPSVNQDVRDSLPNSIRWVSDTMLEIADLCQTDVDTPASQQQRDAIRDQLRQRIERSVQELRHQRWGYSLGGNLIWNIGNARRDLWNQSGSLRNTLDMSLELIRKRNQMLRDNPEPSPELQAQMESLLQEIVGPSYVAFGQVLDRRDLHQRRGFADPMFASDMGLAHRAWTRCLEDWTENSIDSAISNAARTKNLEDVSQAFRTLEAAHELVEAKLMLQTLRSQEQYDWRSLEGQLTHATQWDTIANRIDWGQQWLREAGVPHPLAEKLNALRYGELANQIAQKLHPRRDSNNQNLVSAADDMQRLLTQWKDAEDQLQPVLDAARATLAKFAPSISELADRAAQATQRLQSDTQKLQDANARPAVADMIKSQIESERNMQQLLSALIEQAGQQDLLDKQELQKAQDRDQALRLLDAVSIPMKAAVDQVLESMQAAKVAKQKMDSVSESLVAEALQRESKTLEALKRVAEHFAKAEALPFPKESTESTPSSVLASDASAPMENSESSESLLRQAEMAARELSLDPEMPTIRDPKADYAKAVDLANASGNDPRTLLENLERELKSDSSMQAELSEIAKATAQSVANSLRNAAKEENQLAAQVESADTKLLAEKRMQVDRAQAVAEQVERFAARSLDKSAQAVQAANAAGKQESSKRLNETASALRDRANAMKQLNENSPREQFQTVAQSLTDAVAKAQQALDSVNREMQPTVSQAIHKEEQQRVNTQQKMENIQKQNRNDMIQQSSASVQRAKQVVQEAKQRAQEIVKPLNEARKRTEEAKKRFADRSSKSEALEQLRSQAVQEEQLLQKSLAAKERIEQAEEFLKQAEQRKGALEEASSADLDKPNPRAALAADQLIKSKDQMDLLEKQMGTFNQESKKLPEPKSPASALENLQRSQKKVEKSAVRLARDVDQAARHEQRLGNTEGATKLTESARAIEKVAENQLAEAQKMLGQSATAAENAEKDQAKSLDAQQEISSPFERPGTQTSVDSLQLASQELLGKAQQLENAVAGKDATKTDANQETGSSSKPSADGAQQPNNQQAGAPKSAQEKARMLDQLDRQLNSKQGESIRSMQDSIRQSADQLANSMNQERLDQRSNSQQAKSKSANKSKSARTQGKPSLATESGEDWGAPTVVGGLPERGFETNREWGQLREQSAEDVVEGNRDEFDPEYNEAIQAYYRAISKP